MMALQDFTDVPVMPVTRVDGHIALGGPVWPEFERQRAPRHCRGEGDPVDRCPPVPPGSLPRFRRAAVWGGYLDTQFGHLVAEHLSRLLPSIRQRPHDIVLLALPPGCPPERLATHVWDLLDWFGVERRRIRFITQPVLAPELRVAAQGEILGSRPPDPSYLDLLDDLAARNGVQGHATQPIVFVGRAGMTAKGAGGHLGEGYLAEVLAGLGVTVFDPGKATIRDQIHCYHSAQTLVFSEGSAIHGRQLLGRLDQDVVILKRRPGYAVGQVPLAPRCRSVSHLDVCAGQLRAYRPQGELRHISAVFYDTEALLDAFETLGVPLRQVWDGRAYLRHALADAEGWMASHPADLSRTERNLALIEAESRLAAPLPPVTAPASARPRLH